MAARGIRQRGFTMIELMTVVVIAGVLLVLALPAFNDMLARRRLEGQANELVTDLAYAKSESVQRNRNVVLIPGGGGTCYTLAAWTETAARTGSCDCTLRPANPACSPVNPTDPVELKTVILTNAVTVAITGTFDFEPVRGAQQSAAAASAVVTDGTRSNTVSVAANGRIAPFTP
jgi:prepilin-type N-terminal cleavage/methylation domain-containing protein